MATLVLTAVGAAVAGPIGAAIGAIAGQQIDARLFAPKARHGPRLGDLAVQTSSYGSAIPKLFGTMRVAGTVIWATDLQEHRSRSGGGKGRPETVEYSYSASFAVALSGRPIRAVKRIWADGKLLRGAAGDFKAETKFRLYLGGEDQEADPLIAAAEGIDETPAYRGIAYAMFEDLELADFGNRVPSLTFEVEADAGAVALGAIAETVSEGSISAGATPELAGYAASGDSVRGAIEALADLVSLSLVERQSGLLITSETEPVVPIEAAELGAAGAGGAGGRLEVARRAAGAVPGEVSIVYHDPARDYQSGLQRAVRPGATSRTEQRALPAVIAADGAKGLAEYRLAALWAGRATAKLHLGWRRSGLRPGTLVRIAGEAGLWKVRRWTLDRMVASLDLVRVQGGALPAPSDAHSGRPLAEPDLVHGPTTIHLLDLPLHGEQPAERPQLLVAAAGVEAGWRRATLMASFDGGASWQPAGATAAPAVMGQAVTLLPAAGSALFDLAGAVEVELLSEAMWLEGRSDAALAGGANLALLGNELVQFGTVEALGGRRFRLSRLLRGRRGKEWAAAGHVPGERFVLIEAPSLAVIEPPVAVLGGEARLLAVGIGDPEGGAETACAIDGAALLPPSPVHLRAERLAGGDLRIDWVRRSRSGWAWLSGSDTPLAEERERYRVRLSGAGFAREETTAAPVYVYTAADQAADGAVGPITISVAQAGTFGLSRAATIVDITGEPE